MSEPLKQCCSPACKHPHAVKFFFCDCRSGPGRWKSFIVKSLQELFKHTHKVNMRILYSNFLQTGGRRDLFCFWQSLWSRFCLEGMNPHSLVLRTKVNALFFSFFEGKRKNHTNNKGAVLMRGESVHLPQFRTGGWLVWYVRMWSKTIYVFLMRADWIFGVLWKRRSHSISVQSVPVLIHGKKKKVFSCVHMEPTIFDLYTLLLVLSQAMTEKSLAPTFIFPFHQVFIYTDKTPSEISLDSEKSPVLYSIPLTRFLVPCWTWTDCFFLRWAGVEWRGATPPSTFWWYSSEVNPGCHLSYLSLRLLFNLLSTRSFFDELLFSWVVPASTDAQKYSFQVQDFALLLLEIHEAPVGPILHAAHLPLDESLITSYIIHSSQFS